MSFGCGRNLRLSTLRTDQILSVWVFKKASNDSTDSDYLQGDCRDGHFHVVVRQDLGILGVGDGDNKRHFGVMDGLSGRRYPGEFSPASVSCR